MGPLELTTILQLVEGHHAEAHDIWKNLSAMLYNQDDTSLSHYIHTFFQRHGLMTNLLSANPIYLYAEAQHETAPTLLCYLSYDPQASPSLQARAIAANLLSLITYQTLLVTRADISPITLKWFLVQKNIAHTLQLQHSIEQQPVSFQADACLWYEPLTTESICGENSDRLTLATGTKGYLSVELQLQTARSTLHSHYGAIAPNAVWRLIWALNSLKDQHEEILIAGFYDTMMPPEDEALQQLADLPDTAATQVARWGMPDLLMQVQGKQMHYAHFLTPTCTVNLFFGGEDMQEHRPITPSQHSIPAKARAIVDFYLVPGQEPVDIFGKLKMHLRTRGFSDIHVKLRYAGSPAYTPAHNHFVRQVVQSAEQVYGQSPIILPVLPEYVPIHSFAQKPYPPTIILPLYTLELQKRVNDDLNSLYKSTAHLLSCMLYLGTSKPKSMGKPVQKISGK